IEYIKSNILPLARVVTPNIPEAEVLLDNERISAGNMEQAAKKIAQRYNVSVLLKAGHIEDEYITDYFYNNETGITLTLGSKKIDTKNTHGTGCTMSSALASMLALGKELDEAVTLSHTFIKSAIAAGADYNIGHGHGPVHHFFNYWKD
ncbi:MAG: hydroxymethylpyrimidine/phosphomethylpyrimidine kinase, partial [Bacteroidales bacterium]|nr:hydroxymethylpyrimidine/phosphomethylpyrimidine kinase [Bacteroidales bacterium]